jgi:hypothetical protein
MQINDYKEKIEIIRRYRVAKQKANAKVSVGVNAPTRVQLQFDGETNTFTLTGNEMVSLLAEFDADDLGQLLSN